jgi:hypothetical protein
MAHRDNTKNVYSGQILMLIDRFVVLLDDVSKRRADEDIKVSEQM